MGQKHLLTWILMGMCLMMLCAGCGREELVAVTYTFEGAHADEAGFAEGTITLTPSHEDAATKGYYLLYFADRNGLLADYDEFACVPITGDEAIYTVKNGTYLPPAATKLAVFESETPFLEEQPDYHTCAAVIKLPREKRLDLGEPTFAFGAASDVHMNYEFYGRGAYQKWENAVRFFKEEQMDKIIVTGDMTGDADEQPLEKQYETYTKLIRAAEYPLEDVHECIGNHGNTEDGRRIFVQSIADEEEIRPLEGTPWYAVLAKGKTESARDNLFLFMAQELRAPGDSNRYDNFSKEQIDWVEEMLATYSDTDTNIFIALHSPFLNYGAGDRHPGDYTTMVTLKPYYLQTMRLKKLLERHKDVIVLSGHTHLSLYDGENYSDEDGTSCRMIHLGSSCCPATYAETGKLHTGDGRHAVDATYGSEVYTVRVYDDYILFVGHNLSTGTVIPSACYLLPTVTKK